MRILVIGGTGFIGSNLIKRIIRERKKTNLEKVIALVRPGTHIPDFFKSKWIEVVSGDILDPKSIAGKFLSVDVVVNCSGVLGGWGKEAALLYQTNVLGVVNLVRAAASNPKVKQFIHLSTAGVYGPYSKNPPEETSFFNPTNDYERTKVEGDKVFRKLARKHKINWTVIRPELVYGPQDKQLLPLFRLVKKGKFVLIGNGSNQIQPTFIQDLLSGILLCLGDKKAFKQIYNLGGKRISSKQFLLVIHKLLKQKMFPIKIPLFLGLAGAWGSEFLGNLFGFKPIVDRSKLRFFGENLGCDTTKIEKELGFSSQYTLEEGLKVTFRWYQENNLL